MSVDYVVLSPVFSAIKGLAAILTLCRLGFRLKIQKFWWEDAWALVASVCTTISIVSTLVSLSKYEHKPILILGWINLYMFTSVVWSVRMSLLLSVIRITASTLLRRIILAVAACFLLFWATTMGLRTWWCANNMKTVFSLAQCSVPSFIIIFDVTTNCGADATIVIFSLKLLWKVKLPKWQRRMIILLFSASRYLCVSSLAHSIAQLLGVQTIRYILGELQLIIFMIVCNSLVVVTFIYRVFMSSADDDLSADDDDFTIPPIRSTQNLTTVDLGMPPVSVSKAESRPESNCLPSSTD